MVEPTLASEQLEQSQPAVEVRINFGMFTGRVATPAEIDELARALRTEVRTFSIVAEQRHEFANDVEAAVHQIVISVEAPSGGAEALRKRIAATADAWAHSCIADRNVAEI